MVLELSTFYLTMAVLDIIAALIALYVFYRLLVIYLKIGLPSFIVLSLGFVMLFFSFMVSAGYYLNAFHSYQIMVDYMPPWMREMHWEMMREMGMMPPHWPHMMNMLNTGPSTEAWFLVRSLYIVSYVLILAGIMISRTGVGDEGERVFAVAGFIPVVFSVNLVAIVVLTMILAIIYDMNRGRLPSVFAGYVFLLLSHVLEILATGSGALAVLVIAEVLRPLALLSIAIGVSYGGKQG